MHEQKVDFGSGYPTNASVCLVKHAPIHWHNHVLEVVFPLEGSLEVTQNHEVFSLSQGDFCFINAGCPHRLTAVEPNGCILATVHVQLLNYETEFDNIHHIAFRNQPLEDMSSDFKLSRAAFERRMLDALFQCVSQQAELLQRTDLETAYAQGSRLLSLAIGDFFELYYKVGKYWFISDYQFQRFHRTVRFVRENCQNKISVGDILERELISKTYFSQFWAKFSNQPFSEFLLMQRLAFAEKLLLSTELSLEEVSRESGFSAARYLYKYFLKCYHCKPLTYKKKCLDYQKTSEKPALLSMREAKEALVRFQKTYLAPNAFLSKRLDEQCALERYQELGEQKRQAIQKNSALDLEQDSVLLDLTQGKCLRLGEEKPSFNRDHIVELLTLVELLDVIPHFHISYMALKENELKGDFLELLDFLEEIFGVQRLKSWQYWLTFDTPVQQAEAAGYLERVRSKVGYSSAHLSIHLT